MYCRLLSLVLADPPSSSRSSRSLHLQAQKKKNIQQKACRHQPNDHEAHGQTQQRERERERLETLRLPRGQHIRSTLKSQTLLAGCWLASYHSLAIIITTITITITTARDMSARTRRQKAVQQAQAQAQAQSEDEHADSLANGHSNGSKNGSAESKMNGSARRKRSPPRDGQKDSKENIFLFWPNIIGT